MPVGQDQLPHIELAREVVRRMNHLFGPLFPEPQALLAEFPLVLGPDNRKMSKSYGNALTLGMDGRRDRPPGHVHDHRPPARPPRHPRPARGLQRLLVAPPLPGVRGRAGEVYRGCTTAVLGCVEDKRDLAARVRATVAPIRERREALLRDPDRIDAILDEGAERARAIAAPVLAEVKGAMGL